MSGTVAPDGSVVLTGTGFIPASGLSGAFTLRLRMANPIALAGTISTDLIFGGIVRATLTGTILSAARE